MSIPSGETAPLARMQGVRMQYPGAAAPVLDGVDLELSPGDLVSVLGRSGAGKSTLLHLLGCVDRATGGAYRLRGLAVREMGEKALAELRAETIGFVFQNYHLIDHLTVRQNLEVRFLYGRHPRTGWRAGELDRILADLGLADLAARYPRHLSGGEMQRVALARALVRAPSLILADEPTGNLDAESSEGVFRLLAGAAEAGAAVVIATHDEAMAARCERRLRIRQGRLEDAP